MQKYKENESRRMSMGDVVSILRIDFMMLMSVGVTEKDDIVLLQHFYFII